MKALKMDRLNSQKQKADDDASQKPEKKPEGPSFEDIVGMLDRLKSEKQMKPTSSKVQFLPSFFECTKLEQFTIEMLSQA